MQSEAVIHGDTKTKGQADIDSSSKKRKYLGNDTTETGPIDQDSMRKKRPKEDSNA